MSCNKIKFNKTSQLKNIVAVAVVVVMVLVAAVAIEVVVVLAAILIFIVVVVVAEVCDYVCMCVYILCWKSPKQIIRHQGCQVLTVVSPDEELPQENNGPEIAKQAGCARKQWGGNI